MSYRKLAFLLVVVACCICIPVAAELVSADLVSYEKGVLVDVQDAKAILTAGNISIEARTILDGKEFIPVETSTVSSKEIWYSSGEKDLFVLPAPEIQETFVFSDGKLEETLVLKSPHTVSYRVSMPDGARLVPWLDGSYKIENPAVDENLDGYITVSRAVGFDANGKVLEFGYSLTAPDTLSLVFPKEDEKSPVVYPITIDPVFSRTYDMKMLMHMNYFETGNTSIYNFPDSSRYFLNTQAWISNVSSLTPKFGNGSMTTGNLNQNMTVFNPDGVVNLNETNWTVNFFFRVTSAPGYNRGLIEFTDGGLGTNHLSVFVDDASIRVLGYNASTAPYTMNNSYTVSGGIPQNVWHQVTIVQSGTTNQLYFNGSLKNTTTKSITLQPSGYPRIVFGGSVKHGGTLSGSGIPGHIDEASVWTGGLSKTIDDFYPASEFPMYRNSSVTYGGYGDDNYTAALFHFDGVNNGANFTDQSGKLWSPTAYIRTATNWSKFGPTGAFGAADGRLTLLSDNQDFNFGTDDWTVDAWTNITQAGGFSMPLSTYSADTGMAVVCYEATQVCSFGSNNTGSWASDVAGAFPITINEPFHVAFVRNGTSLKAYKNGQLQFSGTIPASNVYRSYTTSASAANSAYANFDELRITKGLARWTSNFTPPYYAYEMANASFTESTSDYTLPVAYQFNDTSPDSDWTANSYYWSFGDGDTSTERNPTHSYATNGTKTVSLTVFNNNMSSTSTESVVVGAPVAAFHGSPTTGTAALLVQFTDDSQNLTPITAWNWSFGDGEYSSSQSPQHVYSSYGVFSVNLTVTCADGSDYELKEDYIITSTEQGVEQYYSAHQVRITVLDYLGNDIEDATVTANYIENTFPDAVVWLSQMYGIPNDIAEEMLSTNTHMTGITGSDGAVVFTMHSSLKYWINVSGGGSIMNESVYPKESDYNIWLPAPSPENLYEVVNATLTFTEPNSSYFTMGGVFQDHSGNTSAMLFYVNATNGTPVYQTSVAPGTGNISLNHTVQNVRGEGYYWGIRCTRTGGNVSLDQGVTGKGPSGVMIDLGIPAFYYQWIALFLLFLVTSIASKANVRFFAILLPLTAALFWWFGWMSGAYLGGVIPLCGALGAIYYMKGSLRENYGVGGPGSMLMNIVTFLIIFQLMIGFINGLGVFDQAAMMTPSNQFTNVGLTDIQNDVSNFGGINDPLQSANAYAAIGWSTIKIALNMVASVFVVGIFLIEMFPYVPAGFFAILQAGIWILYIVFILKMIGKSGSESDF